MRQFTQEEKKIIDYICSFNVLSEDSAISNLLTKFCHCSFQWEKGILMLSYNGDKYDHKDVLESILTIVCLLKYLEDEALIFVFERTNISDRSEIINTSENHVKFSDKNVVEQHCVSTNKCKSIIDGKERLLDNTTRVSPLSKLCISWNLVFLVERYAKSVLYCTETLRHIKKQNYLDDETIRYNRSFGQTRLAIIVSTIIGIVEIGGNVCSCIQNKEFHKDSMVQAKTYIVIHDTIPTLELMHSGQL